MLFPMQPSKLSPAQAAEILGIQKRTLRRWANLFALALSPSAAAKDKKRFFSGTDIETLRRVQRLKESGLKLSEIKDVLPIVPADQDSSTALTLSPESNIALGTALARTQQIADELIDQDERLDRLEKWARSNWLRKIFTKPEGD